MTTHSRFVDEPDVPVAQHPESLTGERRRRKKKTLRWLLLLSSVTLFLLFFQLVLGWAAGAVTLLADSGHSAADVVSYGLNFLVEWLKAKSARRDDSQRAISISKAVDTWGALASLVLLSIAIVWAIYEAMEVLRSPLDKESESIGLALLFFALVSTTANAGMVVGYSRLHQRPPKSAGCVAVPTSSGNEFGDCTPMPSPPPVSDATAAASSVLPTPADDVQGVGNVPPVPKQLDDSRVPDAPAAVFPPSANRASRRAARRDAFDTPTPSPPMGVGDSQVVDDVSVSLPPLAVQAPRRGARGAVIGLNLRGDFAGISDDKQVDASARCQKRCCVSDQTAEAPECRAGAEGSSPSVLATLHLMVHPGCACVDQNTGDAETAEGDVVTLGESSVQQFMNLNLVAAMLHLITDVVRGVLILFVALLIQLGGVQDASKADAVCALVVATLIALGSLALLVRVFTRLYTWCFAPAPSSEQQWDSTSDGGK